jgi:NitT/TauT family transport system ATP-binding protein
MADAVNVQALTIEYVKRSTGEPLVALDNVDLKIGTGELVTVIGPSGCGKSTLLHCVGGLLKPTLGTVEVGGEALNKPDPKRAAFVFQEYTLLPWRSVIDNVALGLKYAGVDKATRHERAMGHLELMGLAEFARSTPGELSGGMQQRVAVARALTMEPDLMLMDEPFGALDEQTRMRVGEEISRVFTLERRAAMFVTHSLDEAVFLADRIVLLSARPGRIKEEIVVDTPRPRERDFMASTEFAELRAHLFASLDQPAAEDTAA